MKYLSVCSGIEAATAAWHPLGWEPVGFAEIEAFPAAVLNHHYPSVKNFGDMTKYKEWDLGTVELLVGGTPCQSFSVAGLRKGLADPRGNLALVYCGILDHFRPKWFVWENVPGVLSSNGGRDFGSFLGALVELGYGFAYRVLDAQYFGVAQRRRRVFVVGYLGDWRPAAEVLFEPESVRGNPAPSRKAGQKVAGTFKARANSGGWGSDVELAAAEYMQPVAQCLTRGVGQRYDPETESLIPQPIALSDISSRDKNENGKGWKDDGTMYTLDTTGLQGVAQPMCFQQNTRDEVRYIGGDGQIAGALAAEAGMKQQNYIQQGVAQPMAFDGYNQTLSTTSQTIRSDKTDGDHIGMVLQGVAQPFQQTADCLTAAYGTKWNGNASADNGSLFANHGMAVRRLTPVECERLQGFPDGYTNIPWRKAPEAPDGPRYKALGNSMAVPVMAWIGKRIAEYEQQADRSRT